MMLLSVIAVLILLIVLSFVWPPDSPWSPWWRTSRRVARIACRLASVSKKDTVYELGSGDGEFILTAAKEFNVKKAVGVEIDYSRYIVSLIKKSIRNIKNAQLKRQDFKSVKLSDATVVYFYLVPAVIERILPKLKKDLKPGTRIISYRYKVPLKLLKKKEGLFLYEI